MIKQTSLCRLCMLCVAVWILGSCNPPAKEENTSSAATSISSPIGLAGTWENQYGSTVQLQQLQSGVFIGVYMSSTGSSGKYLVIGTAPSDSTGNIPVSLSVYWKSLAGGPSDPTWDWVSVMCGELQNDATNGPQLELLHGMVASTPFEAIQVFGPGVFTETLIFTPVAQGSDELQNVKDIFDKKVAANDSLSGLWSNVDTTSRFEVLELQSYTPAPLVDGTMMGDNNSFDIAGVTDVDSSPSMLQTVAFTGMYKDENGQRSAVTFGGFFDPVAGQLELICYKAIGAAFGNRYASVNVIGTEIFVQAEE